MYINESPIYADKVIYDGKRDPDEVVGTINWCVADVLDMMTCQGIALTDENLDIVLGNRFRKTLEERSVEEGWEIMECLVDYNWWYHNRFEKE